MEHETQGQRVAEQRHMTALLIIDVQTGLFHKATPIYNAEQLLHNIDELTTLGHRAGMPVCFVQHSNKQLIQGTAAWQLHPQLHPVVTDLIIHKRHPNAFDATELNEILQAKKVKRVVVTGLVTHGCVQATCIAAKKLGYQVTLVKDAHSNYNKNAAELIDQWHQILCDDGAELKTTKEIVF